MKRKQKFQACSIYQRFLKYYINNFEHKQDIIFRESYETQHYEISPDDILKYFTFIQRLFDVEDLETAAELFTIMSEREQEKFYTLMKAFIDPNSHLARERVLHWANPFIGKVQTKSNILLFCLFQ